MNFIYDILSWPFGQLLYLFYRAFNNNYLASLIAFTIFANLLLLPMSVSQQKQQAKSMRARSKIEKIRKKYGNDQQKLQEELQAYYKREGYGSMTGGCGILAIQFPIIMGLYGAIYKPVTYILRIPKATINLLLTGITTGKNTSRVQEIAILDNVDKLAKKFPQVDDSVFQKIRDFDFTAFGYSLAASPKTAMNNGAKLAVLVPVFAFAAALASALYSYYRSKKLNIGGDKSSMATMGCMTVFMPLMSLWMAMQFPAGIGIYWGVNSLLSFLRTWLLDHTHSPNKVIAKVMVDESIERRNHEALVKQTADYVNSSKSEV
jgi:YidC/Oxa1 family membrane protein insertase